MEFLKLLISRLECMNTAFLRILINVELSRGFMQATFGDNIPLFLYDHPGRPLIYLKYGLVALLDVANRQDPSRNLQEAQHKWYQ